jgi:cation/acetate symporter
MGIFSSRVTREGAISGMVIGLGVTLFYVFQHKGVMFVADWRFFPSLGKNWFFGIEPNAFGCIGAAVNFVVALSVSRLTSEPPERVRRLVQEIRIPAGSVAAPAQH